MYDMLGKMLGLVDDTERVEIGLSVDPARGLTFRTRLLARPGTALESMAREVRPFQIDPVIFAGMAGAPMLVGATSIGPFWREIMASYRAHVAASKEKGAAAALAYYDAYLAAMGDMQSATRVGRPRTRPTSTIALSQTLKDAAERGQARGRAGHNGQRGDRRLARTPSCSGARRSTSRRSARQSGS